MLKYGTFGTVLGPTTYGVGRYLKEDNDFKNSSSYQKFLKDPNYNNYLNLNDGGFLKSSSLDNLERKYKRAYEYKIGGKPIPSYLKKYAE